MNALKAVRAVLLGLAIGVLFTQFGLSLMRVVGHSMDPTLAQSELVVVLRPPVLEALTALGAAHWGQQTRGAVVVAPEPRSQGRVLGMGRPLIVKRVVGVPHEQVAFQEGELFVDGVSLPEPWVSSAHRGSFSMRGSQVPEGAVFIAGDNRLPLASSDSRQFGPVPVAALRGRVVARLRLPWSAGAVRWPVESLL